MLNVYHLLVTPYYLTLFGSGQLQAEVWFQLHSFHDQWSMSLIVCGIHLVLLGYLSSGPATSNGYLEFHCSSLDWGG